MPNKRKRVPNINSTTKPFSIANNTGVVRRFSAGKVQTIIDERPREKGTTEKEENRRREDAINYQFVSVYGENSIAVNDGVVNLF